MEKLGKNQHSLAGAGGWAKLGNKILLSCMMMIIIMMLFMMTIMFCFDYKIHITIENYKDIFLGS